MATQLPAVTWHRHDHHLARHGLERGVLEDRAEASGNRRRAAAHAATGHASGRGTKVSLVAVMNGWAAGGRGLDAVLGFKERGVSRPDDLFRVKVETRLSTPVKRLSIMSNHTTDSSCRAAVRRVPVDHRRVHAELASAASRCASGARLRAAGDRAGRGHGHRGGSQARQSPARPRARRSTARDLGTCTAPAPTPTGGARWPASPRAASRCCPVRR